MPTIMRMLAGEAVEFTDKRISDFGKDADDTASINPQQFFQANSQVAVYSVRPRTEINSLAFGSIAMVNIAGPVMKDDVECGGYGMATLAQLVTRLGNADNIAGIIINLDTPGGQAYGTSMLADAIKAADAKKPVLSLIDDGMAASAGMWIASAGREIYLTKKTSKVGSIGVYTTIADFNQHYQDYWKLKVKDIYAPQSEDKNKIYHDALEGNDDELKADLAVLAQEFIETISVNRGTRLKSDVWNTGKMFYAKDALKIGLIDGIKSFEQVIDRMTVLIKSDKSSSKNSSNNMANKNEAPVVAFKRTLAAAKADAFAVTDEGFVATEENLNNIEAALAAGETAAADLATANTTIATHVATIATHEATIETQAARIAELENEVAELNDAASGGGTVLEITGDTAEKSKVRSYNDPNNEINKKAARLGL